MITDKVAQERKMLLDRSGYPFQLAVEEKIGSLHTDWLPYRNEVPWEDRTGQNGYADLLLRSNTSRMVIECKRLNKETSWVFLVLDSGGQEKNISWLRSAWIADIHSKPILSWFDFMVTPYSYESSFCSGFEGTRESLERIAGTLLTATDCIARDEHALTREKEDFLVVIPVIITTAKLFIHVMKKNSVALDSGILHGDNVPVQEVPFIRFRKSMTTKLTDEFTVSDFDAACDNRVRSILVVNSNHLEEVFCSWRLSKGFGAVYPWERLRKLPVEVRFLG